MRLPQGRVRRSPQMVVIMRFTAGHCRATNNAISASLLRTQTVTRTPICRLCESFRESFPSVYSWVISCVIPVNARILRYRLFSQNISSVILERKKWRKRIWQSIAPSHHEQTLPRNSDDDSDAISSHDLRHSRPGRYFWAKPRYARDVTFDIIHVTSDARLFNSNIITFRKENINTMWRYAYNLRYYF
jgi:hypothetical protein